MNKRGAVFASQTPPSPDRLPRGRPLHACWQLQPSPPAYLPGHRYKNSRGEQPLAPGLMGLKRSTTPRRQLSHSPDQTTRRGSSASSPGGRDGWLYKSADLYTGRDDDNQASVRSGRSRALSQNSFFPLQQPSLTSSDGPRGPFSRLERRSPSPAPTPTRGTSPRPSVKGAIPMHALQHSGRASFFSFNEWENSRARRPPPPPPSHTPLTPHYQHANIAVPLPPSSSLHAPRTQRASFAAPPPPLPLRHAPPSPSVALTAKPCSVRAKAERPNRFPPNSPCLRPVPTSNSNPNPNKIPTRRAPQPPQSNELYPPTYPPTDPRIYPPPIPSQPHALYSSPTAPITADPLLPDEGASITCSLKQSILAQPLVFRAPEEIFFPLQNPASKAVLGARRTLTELAGVWANVLAHAESTLQAELEDHQDTRVLAQSLQARIADSDRLLASLDARQADLQAYADKLTSAALSHSLLQSYYPQGPRLVFSNPKPERIPSLNPIPDQSTDSRLHVSSLAALSTPSLPAPQKGLDVYTNSNPNPYPSLSAPRSPQHHSASPLEAAAELQQRHVALAEFERFSAAKSTLRGLSAASVKASPLLELGEGYGGPLLEPDGEVFGYGELFALAGIRSK